MQVQQDVSVVLVDSWSVAKTVGHNGCNNSAPTHQHIYRALYHFRCWPLVVQSSPFHESQYKYTYCNQILRESTTSTADTMCSLWGTTSKQKKQSKKHACSFAAHLLVTYAAMLRKSGTSVPTPKSQNGMSKRLGTITLYVSNPSGHSSRYWSQRGVTPAMRASRHAAAGVELYITGVTSQEVSCAVLTSGAQQYRTTRSACRSKCSRGGCRNVATQQ